MATLSSVLKVSSVFALVTGSSDVLLGAGTLAKTTNTPFPVRSAAEVLADSQIRFLGSAWAAFGGLLWWISNDVDERRVPLAILGGFMVFGGIGRAISGALYGFPSRLLVGATTVELVAPPAIWLLGGWQ